MPSTEHEAAVAFLDELTAATRLGKINWKSVNPTTFVWETIAPKAARVSLQRVERVVQTVVRDANQRPQIQQRKEVNYLCQVVDLTQAPSPMLNVDSSDDPKLDAKLAELFNLVKTGITEKTLEFLRSILPK